MTDPLGEPGDGTPLTDEERQGLHLPVLTRDELNRAEADNISQAMTWLFLRFGYRLVAIHPFPNGNGRWSRLAADALIVALGGNRFTWGGASLTETGQLHRSYITALQTADTSGDYGPLATFARS